MAYRAKPVHQRFFASFDKTDRCWLWKRGMNKAGYGRFYINWRMELAHRVSYELHLGPIPDGMCVLHRCDVRSCVNPAHLFLGTQTVNHADMCAKGREPRGESHRNSKLMESDVRAIRMAEGRHSDIAASYGISKGLVSQIKRNIIWRHL